MTIKTDTAIRALDMAERAFHQRDHLKAVLLEIQRRAADAIDEFDEQSEAWKLAADVHQLVCLGLADQRAGSNEEERRPVTR